MFSGIIEESARVSDILTQGALTRLRIKSELDHSDTKIGDSIAIEGVCLTVVHIDSGLLDFELLEETLRRSTLGTLSAGAAVNLERSIRVGDRIHGHFVFGHVDGTARVLARTADGECERYALSMPPGLSGMIVPKGSVSLAGTSLTVGEVDAESFSVYIIPHTAAVTTLPLRQPGDSVNVEVDMLARYIRAALQCDAGNGSQGAESDAVLRARGYLGERV